MPLSLTKRIPLGAPLSAAQHDANLTAIEGAVNTNTTAVATLNTNSAINSQFEGIVTGKQTVDWANVINKPTELKYPFRAVVSAAAQLVSGGSSANITFDTKAFDPNTVFDTGTGLFTAPLTGYYHFDYSTHIELNSGSPTAISILVSLLVNGSGADNATIDLDNNTGGRIYKAGTLLHLLANDTVGLNIDITQTGSGDWQVTNNPSGSFLTGFLLSAG